LSLTCYYQFGGSVLEYADEPNHPDWWLVRLGGKLTSEQPRFDTLDAYWSGDHPLPFGNRKMREAYKRFQKQSRTNFTELVAESVIERLKVTGFRTGGKGTETLDQQAWSWWQDNSLDADSSLVHRAAVVMSRAYVIVGPDPDNADKVLVTVEDPRQVIHEAAPTNRRKMRAALKTWWDDVEGRNLAVVYLPDSIHYYRSEQAKQQTAPAWSAAKWEVDTGDPAYPDGVGSNPLGVVPVVPFMNRPDLKGNTKGEFETVTPIQDRINTEVLDRLVISAMQAYRQRWATGTDLTDRNGEGGGFDPGADLLWNVSDDKAKFGEFQPADLVGILKAVEADVQHLAAITRTPPHYLLGAIVNASGDALAAAETGLTSKVGERMTEFGESWEAVYQLAGRVLGTEIPSSCEVIWDDPEFRTLTEMAAANVQLMQAGVPWRTRMAMLKFTPSQIERMVTERTQDALLNLATSLNGAPGQSPGQPGTPGQLPGSSAGPSRLIGGSGGAAVPAQQAARAALPVGSRNGTAP
jgi:hypothetical protein